MPSFFPATLGVMLALAVRCRGHAYFVHFEGRQTHPVAVSTDGARLFALNTPHARLSGNGTLSCASCHINADRDGLAWDLGDPGGVMGTAPGKNLASGNTTTVFQRPMHPMKGPMLTPTLRNAYTGAAYNWRGDAPLAALGSHFVSKPGGSALTVPEWQVFIEYLLTLYHHPNPHRNLNNPLPVSFSGGNAMTGQQRFQASASKCLVCHSRTVTVTNRSLPALTAALNIMEQQAATGFADIVCRGRLEGRPQLFLADAFIGQWVSRPQQRAGPDARGTAGAAPAGRCPDLHGRADRHGAGVQCGSQ